MARTGSRPRVSATIKALARAAYHGHRVQAEWAVGEGQWTVASGYLVGMDDFYIHLVEVDPEGHFYSSPPAVLVIHKRVDVLRISGEPTLSEEPEGVRQKLQEIGGDFWNFCGQAYLGKPGDKSKESQ